ncbi:hypothetical protein L9F63_016348, partial [Diploptera punctata]
MERNTSTSETPPGALDCEDRNNIQQYTERSPDFTESYHLVYSIDVHHSENSDQEIEEATQTQPLKDERFQYDDKETKCGFGSFKPDWLQILASKKCYVVVYGLIGMFQIAAGTYLISSLSTLEKRFKIPSRTSGLILSAWDIGGFCVSMVLTYLGSKGHKTRWVAAGIIIVALSCFLRIVPHIAFGPGQNSLELTVEYADILGTTQNSTETSEQFYDILCRSEYFEEEDCSAGTSAIPSAIFISASLLLGVGTSMYFTLGISYLDDNVRKNKSPVILAISQCIRMLGPTIGYLFGSYALKQYVDPSLHPTISSDDPRWVGAWWLGWVPLGIIFIVLAVALSFFPKMLPRAAQRMAVSNENGPRNTARSFADFKLIIARLSKNKILLFNSFSIVCFACGFIGYWIFMPKYMETQFRQSASQASLITDLVEEVTCIGVTSSRIVISKFKPRARYLAAWNVVVELCEVIGYFSYSFITCGIDDLHGEKNTDGSWNLTAECNMDCECGLRINYSPVCSLDRSTTFYSPCHAGCTTVEVINGTKTFGNCSCIGQGWAVEGACPFDCTTKFTTFLVIQCILRFLSSSGRAGNTLIQFRSVAPEDKSISISFTEFLMCALGLIPGPIFYGMLL